MYLLSISHNYCMKQNKMFQNKIFCYKDIIIYHKIRQIETLKKWQIEILHARID
jgi:hypothetical protein